MTPILDELERWLDGPLVEAKERRELGKALNDAVAALARHQAALTRLDDLRSGVAVAARVGAVPEPTRLEVVIAPLQRLARLLNTASDGPELHALMSRLEDLPGGVDAVQRLFAEAWAEHCSTRFVEHAALGDLLKRLQPTQDLGGRMVATTTKGTALGRRFPPDEASLAVLQNCEEAVAMQQAELTQARITPAVVSFLRIAASGDATLLDADGEPLEWLKKYGGLGSVKLAL